MTRSDGGSVLRRFIVGAGEVDGLSGECAPEGAQSRRIWLLNRPSLPPILFLSGGLWLGVVLSVDALFESVAQRVLPACIVAAMLFACAFLLFLVGKPAPACVVLGLGLGCCLGVCHVRALYASSSALNGTNGTFIAQITRDARDGEFGASALARLPDGTLVRLNVPLGSDLLVGDRISFHADWKEPGIRIRQSSWRDGIAAVSKAQGIEVLDDTGPLAMLRAFRRSAIAEVERVGENTGRVMGMPLDEASMMVQAVVLGHVGGLYGSSLYQAVKVDGLAHLVAVSGAHLVIVCGMVSLAFRRMPIARGVSIVLQVALILGYLVLTGAPISAIRASFMATLAMLSYFPGRRPYALGALSLCIAVLVACDPASAFSPSLLLSATATLGIVVFMPLFQALLKNVSLAPGGVVSDSLALTLSATLITGAISAFRFGQVSLVAPFANIIATPVFPVICLGGMLTVALSVAAGGALSVLLGALLVFTQLFACVLDAISRVPFAACPASLGVIGAVLLGFVLPTALWVFWPRASLRLRVGMACAFACIGVFMSFLPLLRGDAITMLDVGQGDAILVQSCGRSLLVDTGTEDIALVEGLGACGVRSLDAVVVTHPDDDHCGALPALRGVVDVGKVLVASDLLETDNEHCEKLRISARELVGEDGMVGLSVGDVLELGNMAFVVIGPDRFADGGGNADSLVLRMGCDEDGDGAADYSALFCGDAEAPQIGDYMRKGRIGDVDLYKVGHHGSANAVDDAMLSVLKPEVSIVSVGEGNRYGHPVPDTLDALEQSGSAVFRTDEQGAITCFLRPDGIHVQTER